MLTLDHIAVACTDLAEGTAWVESQLGVTLQPGGKHARYGTHNTLLGLADGLYLEVIAIDPDAAPEAGHSWFALDRFSGPPRLANWICRTGDLDAVLRDAPAEVGAARDLQRGDLNWQITVPDDGSLPFGGAYPTLIQWGQGVRHPSETLTPSGCRLTRLTITHPQADDLRQMVPLSDDRVSFAKGPFALTADIDTPAGPRQL